MQQFDNITHRLVDDLKEEIKKGSKLAIAASCFSIYAYENLKKQLNSIEELKFIFTSPAFLGDEFEKEKREFYIPRLSREKSLYGTEFEICLRNQMNQKAISKECADWIREKVQFKSNKHTSSLGMGFMNIDDSHTYMPINGFTTVDLGTEKGNEIFTTTIKIEAPATKVFIDNFNNAWNDSEQMQDVTEKVLEHIELIYDENSPKFIYMLSLYHIFSEFLEDIDDIPNDATGFKDSQIWEKLFSFQKDAALAIIHKLEKYNGCILADSVGLGKTFTTLAVIKYYEGRNKNVLVLCPKKLSDNWLNFKGNYLNNPIVNDRLRYDVLNHTDLSRTTGKSYDIDLSRINWGNYDLVVIDESHNFRNGGLVTKDDEGEDHYNRYNILLKKVIQSGVKTKVLMLSATPVNNRFVDLKNQLELAYEGVEDNLNEKLKTQKSLTAIFTNAQRAFNTWSKLPADERITENLLEMLDFDFFEVLDSVTIARSRKHIEEHYNMEEIGKFPTRLTPINEAPKLTSNPNIEVNYEKIFLAIDNLNLSVYSPAGFIFPSRMPIYEEKYGKKDKAGISLVGREFGLRQLMAVNLLKRLESSVHSFRLTITKIQEQINRAIEAVKAYETKQEIMILQDDEQLLTDFDIEVSDFISAGGKYQINFADMDYKAWLTQLEKDKEIFETLLASIAPIDPQNDLKLQTLISRIKNKLENPLNSDNKKVIVFTAFADTADYLYEHVSKIFLEDFGIHSAIVSGSTDGRTTVPKMPADFNTVLTCFSPISKDKAKLNKVYEGDIDILIGTDCISEGQNLQDCDYLINFDIHWNPVRIIQRFGRIDRIGSQNDYIQLVNFWPDIKLDEYINLKNRVEARMKISVMTSTGEDNLIDDSEKGDLEYRRKQLEKLQNETVDPEDVSGGITIMDLGLNEFRQDLVEYIKEHKGIEKAPLGMHALTMSAGKGLPSGVIFILRNVNNTKSIDNPNRLHPFYMVYMRDDGSVMYNHLEPKKLLSYMRLVCKSQTKPDKARCKAFNAETNNGMDMSKYSNLLGDAIKSIIEVKDESEVDSLFSDGASAFGTADIKGLGDFELIAFLVLKSNEEIYGKG